VYHGCVPWAVCTMGVGSVYHGCGQCVPWAALPYTNTAAAILNRRMTIAVRNQMGASAKPSLSILIKDPVRLSSIMTQGPRSFAAC
jgi:hypothetical protein